MAGLRPLPRIAFALLAATLVLFAAPAAAEPARRGDALLDASSPRSLKRAVRAWHRDNYEMAIRHADVALSREPVGADLQLALSLSCVLRGELGEIELGLAHCDRLIDLTASRDVRSLVNRAQARMRAGDIEAAIADYRAVLALSNEGVASDPRWLEGVEKDLARAMSLRASAAAETSIASTRIGYAPHR